MSKLVSTACSGLMETRVPMNYSKAVKSVLC